MPAGASYPCHLTESIRPTVILHARVLKSGVPPAPRENHCDPGRPWVVFPWAATAPNFTSEGPCVSLDLCASGSRVDSGKLGKFCPSNERFPVVVSEIASLCAPSDPSLVSARLPCRRAAFRDASSSPEAISIGVRFPRI